MMEQRRVLHIGTQVQLSWFDPFGFCGRDMHPSQGDVGFLGIVTGILEVGGWTGEFPGPGAPGDVLREDDEFREYAVYEVRDPGGRTLHLVDHELTILRGVS